AIIMGKKGRLVFTDGDDEAALAEGARDAYLKRNLRYSQLAPLSMFEEKNTRSNMPAQVEIYAEGAGEHEDAYKLLVIAKGGGSRAPGRRRDGGLFEEEVPPARHPPLPALPPRHRHRRPLGRAHQEDGEAALLPLSRRPADARLRGRPCLPRPRDGAGGAQAH